FKTVCLVGRARHEAIRRRGNPHFGVRAAHAEGLVPRSAATRRAGCTRSGAAPFQRGKPANLSCGYAHPGAANKTSPAERSPHRAARGAAGIAQRQLLDFQDRAAPRRARRGDGLPGGNPALALSSNATIDHREPGRAVGSDGHARTDTKRHRWFAHLLIYVWIAETSLKHTAWFCSRTRLCGALSVPALDSLCCLCCV